MRRRAAPRPDVRGPGTEAPHAPWLCRRGSLGKPVPLHLPRAAPSPGTPHLPGDSHLPEPPPLSAGRRGAALPHPAVGWGRCGGAVLPLRAAAARAGSAAWGERAFSAPPRGRGVEITGKGCRARGAAALFVKLCRSRGDNPDRLLPSH